MGKKSRELMTNLTDDDRRKSAIERQLQIEDERKRAQAEAITRLVTGLVHQARLTKVINEVRKTCKCSYKMRPVPALCRGCSKVIKKLEEEGDV